jgi:hypothetical protein
MNSMFVRAARALRNADLAFLWCFPGRREYSARRVALMGPGDLSLSVSSFFLAMLQLAQLFRRLPPETTPNKRQGHTERTRLYSGRKGRQAGSCEMMLVLPCHT